jgi:hypothetical protein
VFKYLAVTKRSTDDHPIIAGPIFLHGNSDTETFYSFFQQLVGILHDTPSQPILGSDEKKAIRLAFLKAFPGASMMCCTRNLKKNVLDYLQDKCGAKGSDKTKITQAIFGQDGVSSDTDQLTFDHILMVGSWACFRTTSIPPSDQATSN